VTNQQKPAPYQVPLYNQQQQYQGFQPVSQPPENQGFQPVGPGPYRPPPPQNQGFQPVGPGQYRPPPPPPPQYQQAVVIQLPPYITAHHRKLSNYYSTVSIHYPAMSYAMPNLPLPRS